MSFETTNDILEHARKFHEVLSDKYANLGNETSRERLKLLLDYMSRHEKHLSESLEQYEETASRRILETWFQFSPCDALARALREGELSSDLSLNEIIDMAVKLDNCLLNVYQKLAEAAESIEVKELFINLWEMEHREKLLLVKNAMRLNEL